MPPEYSPCDFRDPKIFIEGDTLYCLVAARKVDGRGRILLFSSKDIFNWKFECDVLNRDSGGIMIECPDYNSELGLLTYCEQFQPAQGSKHLNIHSTFYRLGRLDCKTHKSTFGESEIIDYGFDFYAAQIFKDTPVMIGWLNMWERNIPSDKYGFAGMLTVPRKVEVKNGELWQSPVVCARKVYEKETGGTFTDNIKIGMIKINAKNLKTFDLFLRKKKDMYTSFCLNDGEWVFDRSHSGEKIEGKECDTDSLAGIRRMPFVNCVDTEITVVLDEFSVEIFVNGKALSATIYPDIDADGLELDVKADECSVQRFDIL